VSLFKQVAIRAFTPQGVRFKMAGETKALDGFNSVVIAEKMESLREAQSLLQKQGRALYIIGDAKSPRDVMLSISEGEEIARDI
jgi:hypothetical protein